MFHRAVLIIFIICTGGILMLGWSSFHHEARVKKLCSLVSQYQQHVAVEKRKKEEESLLHKYLRLRILQNLKANALKLSGEGARKLYMNNRDFWDKFELQKTELEFEDYTSLSIETKTAVENEVFRLFHSQE